MNTIDIFRCSAGDPHGVHALVDPYWKRPGGWEENSRGDGMSYGGVLLTLHRLFGESDSDFERRAIVYAEYLEALGCPVQPPRPPRIAGLDKRRKSG